MTKKIMNVFLIGTLIAAFLHIAKIFFDLPTDPTKVAKLQKSLGYTYMFLLILLMIKYYSKNRHGGEKNESN